MLTNIMVNITVLIVYCFGDVIIDCISSFWYPAISLSNSRNVHLVNKNEKWWCIPSCLLIFCVVFILYNHICTTAVTWPLTTSTSTATETNTILLLQLLHRQTPACAERCSTSHHRHSEVVTVAWKVFYMTTCTGLMFLNEFSSSSVWQFVGVYDAELPCTWWTTVCPSLTSSVVSIYVPPVVVSSWCRVAWCHG